MTPVYEIYAEALLMAANELGCADVVADELLAMEELLGLCGGYLNSPLIDTREKTALLRELLSDKISGLTLEYILLMTARRHLKHFFAAAEHFRRGCGRAKVVVRLRIPFEPEQEILKQLKDRLKKEKLIPPGACDAEFDIVEDKELIGGFIASCNGYQIDTSLRTSLMRLLRPERLVKCDDRRK
ncbi:MAG: F0F1 ATP synthase subunit delta [Clostridiales bacterium]|nr:F0F1 ATP synthase subunit delta [Clostridiales bacterium]